MKPDALISVAEDLEYLRKWGPEISDADLRRGTSVLRRLLVDGIYSMAWRSIGFSKEPRLFAVDLVSLIDNWPLENIEFGIAGGAHLKGLQFGAMLLHRGKPPAAEASLPVRENGYPGERFYNLSEYLASPSGIVGGECFTRLEVIKYIANVKGGVHLGTKQGKAETKQLIKKMSRMEKRILVHNSDGLLVEIAAIGQSVGFSEDALTLIKAIRSRTNP